MDPDYFEKEVKILDIDINNSGAYLNNSKLKVIFDSENLDYLGDQDNLHSEKEILLPITRIRSSSREFGPAKRSL